MNSGSEKKLSMDELLEKNRPAQMVQTTPQPPAQELTPPPEVHPTKKEWEELLSSLCTLGYHTERQTAYLKKISELLAQLPTQTQMGELLKAVTAQTESAGHSMDQSAVGTGGPGADWAGAVGGVVQLGHALERGQDAAPVRDATTMHYHADGKALWKERQKKIALGHKEDDHEEEQTWQQTM